MSLLVMSWCQTDQHATWIYVIQGIIRSLINRLGYLMISMEKTGGRMSNVMLWSPLEVYLVSFNRNVCPKSVSWRCQQQWSLIGQCIYVYESMWKPDNDFPALLWGGSGKCNYRANHITDSSDILSCVNLTTQSKIVFCAFFHNHLQQQAIMEETASHTPCPIRAHLFVTLCLWTWSQAHSNLSCKISMRKCLWK